MKMHYRRWMGTALAWAVAMLVAVPVMAQDYGVGETRIAAQAPDSMILDGVYEADIWDPGILIDLKGSTSFWHQDLPDDVEEAWARVLFGTDTLYIFVSITDAEVYVAENIWESDQILVGIDPVHE